MQLYIYPNAEPKTVSFLELKQLGRVKIQGKILMINNKVYAHIKSTED